MPPLEAGSAESDDVALAPGTEPESEFAVLDPTEPGTVVPVMPPLPPLPPRPGRPGSKPPELEPPPLLDPPDPPDPPEPLPVGSGSFGTEGRGMLMLPPLPVEPPLVEPPLVEPEPDVVVLGTTDVTDCFTHLVRSLLKTVPAGQTVRPDAAPAVSVPPTVSAKALRVTNPARRTGVLGVMLVMPPRILGVVLSNDILPTW